MLAMDVNDDAGCLEKRVGFIASRGNAVIQIVRVIVNVHREQARSYKKLSNEGVIRLNATRNPAQSPQISPTRPSGCAKTP